MDNLPPGVAIWMIPGNDSDDEAMDYFWDEVGFFDLLKDWAQKENPLLYAFLCQTESKMGLYDMETIVRDIIEDNLDSLPIDKWFEEWKESGGEEAMEAEREYVEEMKRADMRKGEKA